MSTTRYHKPDEVFGRLAQLARDSFERQEKISELQIEQLEADIEMGPLVLLARAYLEKTDGAAVRATCYGSYGVSREWMIALTDDDEVICRPCTYASVLSELTVDEIRVLDLEPEALESAAGEEEYRSDFEKLMDGKRQDT
jgi:hypothetical protein